jgi:hypothetical protein
MNLEILLVTVFFVGAILLIIFSLWINIDMVKGYTEIKEHKAKSYRVVDDYYNNKSNSNFWNKVQALIMDFYMRRR